MGLNLFPLMAGVSSRLELAMIRARVKGGMENAGAKGKHVGRRITAKGDVPAVFYQHYPAYGGEYECRRGMRAERDDGVSGFEDGGIEESLLPFLETGIITAVVPIVATAVCATVLSARTPAAFSHSLKFVIFHLPFY